MKLQLIIFFLCLFFAKVTHASSIPEELLYNGKPIEAMCIHDLIENIKDIDLNKCLFAHPYANKHRTVRDQNLIGYDYTYNDDEFSFLEHRSLYYQYLGKIDNKIALYIRSRSGSSTNVTAMFSSKELSSIVLLERKGNLLIYSQNVISEEYYGHNFSIGSAFLKDNKVHYVTHIPPLTFLRLYDEYRINKSQELCKDFDTLSNSANLYYGIAKFESSDLKYIELIPPDEYEQYEYYEKPDVQECFDIIHKQYIDRGHTLLTVADLEKFMDEVFALYKKHHPF